MPGLPSEDIVIVLCQPGQCGSPFSQLTNTSKPGLGEDHSSRQHCEGSRSRAGQAPNQARTSGSPAPAAQSPQLHHPARRQTGHYALHRSVLQPLEASHQQRWSAAGDGDGQLHNQQPTASRCCLTEKKLPDCLTSLTHPIGTQPSLDKLECQPRSLSSQHLQYWAEHRLG